MLLACGEGPTGTGPLVGYFMSPNGDDGNSGTLNSPWKTLAYALEQLSPGDVLYLRGGTYYEYGITTSLKGTAAAPITIRSYPGEQAVIDGGETDFRSIPNSEWEVVDGSIQLYRSKRSFTGKFAGAWLVDDDVQLVQYQSTDNIESTNYGPLNGMNPFYMGPGVQLRNDRLYIRLQYNPNDLTDSAGHSIDPVPTNTDPNQNRIAVFTSNYILRLDDAQYLQFKDLVFSHSRRIMDAINGSHHIELNGCRFDYGTYGLSTEAGVHDWEIHACEFNNGLPPYVYWTDVKNEQREVAEAHPEFQSDAIEGSLSGFYIHDNLFRNAFDGMDVNDGTHDARITENVFQYLLDDAINIYRGVGNVEVAHNMFWHIGEGVSNLGSNATPGHVYIHHNVIDNSAYLRGGRPGNYRENRWPVWTVIDPFGSHDSNNKTSWWKIYNNTIVTRKSGYEDNPAGPNTVTGNDEKYVYNNIFYVIDDRIIFSDDQLSDGSHYDGNVVYQRAPKNWPLFAHFGDGSDYDSLGDFQENSGTDWETSGLELNPGFNLARINDPTFDAATIWDRYRPIQCYVFTSGASYNDVNWPGSEGVDYRGAVPLSDSQHCYLFVLAMIFR